MVSVNLIVVKLTCVCSIYVDGVNIPLDVCELIFSKCVVAVLIHMSVLYACIE